MPESLKALQEKRGKAAKQIRDMADLINKEGRDFTADEKGQWDGWNNEVDEADAQIKAIRERERSDTEAAERRAKALERAKEIENRWTPETPNRETREDVDHDPERRKQREPETSIRRPGSDARQFWADRASPEYRAAFAHRMEDPYNRAFGRFLRSGLRSLNGDDFRALQVDTDTAGGYLVSSEEFVARLIQAIDNQVFVRRYATVYPVASADSLGVPTLDEDVDDPVWTAEIKTGNEDSSLAFGKRSLSPHPVSKRIKVSRTLLRKSVLPVEQIISDRLGYKFGVVEENAYLNGPGGQQPLGIFVASNDGIPASRDVSTDNTATDIKADGLINAKYTLKGQYHAEARWLFHRNAVRNIRKLKDGNGQYLWQAGVASDRPSTILELPYDMSEYAPSTFTAGSYVGALAVWRFYWIADALNLQVQRLDELYAETNQVGFIGRKETDGMPVLAEAFVRVQLAAG